MFGTEAHGGAILLLVVFFAPTIVAALRRRRAVGLTLALNVLIGWSGIGWLLAWVAAFRDRRALPSHTYVVPAWDLAAPAAPWPTRTLVAPDGRHWWDGHAWRDGWLEAPAVALRSPDGRHWFDGQTWIGPRGATAGDRQSLRDEPVWWHWLRADGPA